jgi:sulfhydrogenase subunit delta
VESVDSITAQKKLVVGWFSFTCSEDSTILFTELLNDHLYEWKKVVEFRFLKALKTHNVLSNLDVAFIEGAISSDKQAAEVKKIRDNAKYVVAIGACACTGLPSSSRNDLLPKVIDDKIRSYMKRFDYSDKVRKLSDVIKIDDMVDGCPMNVPKFLEVLGKYLKLCGIVNA